MPTPPNTPLNPRLPPIVLAGVSLVSAGVLAYEIALSRIFSVILTYHFVFVVLSAAMFGLSLGGVAEYFLALHRERRSAPERMLSVWASSAALSMGASIFVFNLLGAKVGILVLSIVALAPFTCVGAMWAGAFRKFAPFSSRVYGADLCGAAFGALLIVWLLHRVDPSVAILVSACGLAGGALLLLFEHRPPIPVIVATGAVFLLITVILAVSLIVPITGTVPIGRNPEKDMYRLTKDPSLRAEIVESRWSPFGRTDLVQLADNQDSMSLFIDGAAGTSMYRWNGDIENPSEAVSMMHHHFPGSIPFLIMPEDQKESALVIGPGGGRDVLIALLSGVKEVTAVEINPDFVAVVRDYADYNGGIYSGAHGVTAYVDEGRNFVKRSAETFDVIMLSLPVTKSSRSYEGYALSENFLFTVESIREYLDHLTPEGHLIIVSHGLVESMKLLTTAIAALEKYGLSQRDAMERLYILGDMMLPVFVLQNRPLDQKDSDLLHAVLHEAGFDGQSSYIPLVEQIVLDVNLADDIKAEWRMMNQSMIDLAKEEVSVLDLIRAYPLNIRPPTDDRPFFFDLQSGVPAPVKGMLWVSLLILSSIIALPRILYGDRPFQGDHALMWLFVSVFSCLGAGFMLIEVTLFQKLILYLGNPTFALALLLASLLIGGGIGSLFSGLISNRYLARSIAAASFLVALAAVLILLLLPSIFDVLTTDETASKFVAAIILIALGCVMGFPFPLSIRLIQHHALRHEIPWMWAVNGAASVVGSVLAVAVAVRFGYSIALFLGGFMYLAVSAELLMASRSRNTKP